MAELSGIVGPAPEPSEERRDSGAGDGADVGESDGGGQVMVDSMADGGGPSSLIGMGPPSPLTGCYLLIILGEPHSDEHKDVILKRLIKGFLSWNMSENHVDLEEELNTITINAPEGENARHGERLIQYASENLVTEILIHPQYNTLIQCMRNLLSSFTRHRHIIHAGYTFSGNGSWILQDGTFSVSDFSEAFQEHEVQRVLRAYPDTVSMDIHCDGSSGLWSALPDKHFAKSCKIRINPSEVLSADSEHVNSFIDYLAPMLAPANLNDLLESSDVVGNIRFSHPTLYVFPGGQGDAALFGINGFNMLVDGGFNRKACFWDFARHLDRLDAVLMTRVNNSNIQGMSSVIERKKNAYVYPQIGHFFCNIPERRAPVSPDADRAKDSLVVDLMDRGQNMVANLKSINLKPQTCYRDIEPMNLYHKVGHGTLDMYVISPSKDSKEVKEFMQKWTTNDQRLFAAKESKDFQFPIQNLVSICALLVWQPANPDDSITRILFPGSTPDFKIIEGLEKVKHLEFMKHPVCTSKKLTPSPSVVLTKKTLKSILPEPAYPPIKTSKLPDVPMDNKIESDNKVKESKLIEEVAEKKVVSKVKSKKIAEEKPKAGSTEKIDSKAESHDEKKDDTTDADEPKKDDAKPKAKKTEAKGVIRSKIDSKPPKSIEKKPKKDVGKASPTSTPKKMTNGVAPKEKEVKPKPIGRPTRGSPSSTPAKSTKEANNRKVLESKQQKTTTTASTKSVAKRDVTSKAAEKKEPKQERKPISYRSTKSMSPSRRAAGSPVKSVKPKTDRDHIIRKAKLDRGSTAESSLVSTPSGVEDVTKKIVGGGGVLVDGSDLDKQRELDELKEEQEAVREIEAVFKREEKSKAKITLSDHREIPKQDSTTEAEDDDEYLIIEKEEVEPYTEDSINEPESSLTKEEEIQKHQRDSQESEKKRKASLEATEEEKEAKESKQPEAVKSPVGDEIQPDSIEAAVEEAAAQDETKEVITTEKELIITKSDTAAEETSSPSPDDKLSSNKKTSDTKDEVEVGAPAELKEGEVINLPESQPFSTTIESGATTAPTLPEDERITLDEIKEDLAIEAKLAKEEAPKAEEILVEAPLPPLETKPPTMRVLPAKMHFDIAQQSAHLRDVVKTPDEVADLPVHEEADIGTYEASEEAKDDKKTIKEDAEKLKAEADVKLEDALARKVMSPLAKSPIVEPKQLDEEDVEVAEEVDVKRITPDGDKEKYVKEDKEEDEDEDKEVESDADDEAEEEIVQKVSKPQVEQLPTSTKTTDIEEVKMPSPSVSEKHESIVSPTIKTPEPKSTKDEDIDSARTSPSISLGKKVEDKLTDLKEKVEGITAEKVEYALEDLGKGFETTLKDVTHKAKTSAPVSEHESSADEEEKEKLPSKVSSPEAKTSVEDPAPSPVDTTKDVLDDIQKTIEDTSKLSSPESKVSVEEVVPSPVKKDEEGIMESPEEQAGFKEVYDYSHPFGVKSFPTELRETHITTLDSPVAVDKDRCIEIKVLEQLAERDEELEHLDSTNIPSVTTFYTDEYPYDRDENNLIDIKEEDEEDRYSASNKSTSRKPSREICELFADKDILSDVLGSIDGQPPRSVSPREVEVLKIVANVAEVLKSEKDIIEIIPDFDEEEFEKKFQRISPRVEDDGTHVQRMLVTASSEDGGEQFEICAAGSIKYTAPSPTPSLDGLMAKHTSSGMVTEAFDFKTVDIKSTAPSEADKPASTSSTPDANISTVSIEEKEKVEISEKLQKQLDDEDVHFPTIKTEFISATFPADKSESQQESPEKLEDKLSTLKEATATMLPDVASKLFTESRKESVISECLDDLDSRRESAISTLSEKDITKDESSIEDSRPPSAISQEIKVEDTILAEHVSEVSAIIVTKTSEGKAEVEIKTTVPSSDDKDEDETRRESTASHISEKSPKDVSRPESIISHFSDQTEPELKEPMGIRAKSPEFDISRPESTDITDITEKEVLADEKVIVEDTKKVESSLSSEKPTESVEKDTAAVISRPVSSMSNVGEKEQIAEVIKESSPVKSPSHSVSSAVSGKTETPPSDTKEVGLKSPEPSVTSVASDKEDDKKSVESKEVSRPDTAQSGISEHDSTKDHKSPLLDEEPHVKSPVSGAGVDTDQALEKTPSEPHELSRPTSVQCHLSEKQVGGDEIKEVSRPSSVIADDEQPIEIASRPESILSHDSEKDVSRQISEKGTDKSRPHSVASVKDDHLSRPVSSTSHISDKVSTDAPSQQETDTKVSPTSSALSSGEVQTDITKDASRPVSVLSESKHTDAEVESRPESVLSHIDDAEEITKGSSRPESVASHKDASRPVSAISHTSEQEVEPTVESRKPSTTSEAEATHVSSRPSSVVSHTEDIVKDARTPSVVSETLYDGKLVSETIKESSSRPESVISHKEECILDPLKESKETSRAESALSHRSDTNIEVKASDVVTVSQPESVASFADEPQKQTRPDSVLSHTSEKDTPKGTEVSRPESAASHPGEIIKESRPPSSVGSIDAKVVTDILRPESVQSQKSEIVPPTDAISRAESVASHQEDIVDKTIATEQTSRPVSVGSHQDESIKEARTSITGSLDDKVVPDTISRPESVASHKDEKDILKVDDSASRPESVTSQKEDLVKDISSTSDTKDTSRSGSVLSSQMEKESDTKLSLSRPESVEPQISRPGSVTSHHDEQTSSRRESIISHKDEKESIHSHKDEEITYRRESVTSTKPIGQDTEETETKDSPSRPDSVASHKDGDQISRAKPDDSSRSESVLSHKGEQETVDHDEQESRRHSVVSSTGERVILQDATKSRSDSITSDKIPYKVSQTPSIVGDSSDTKDFSRPASVLSDLGEKELKFSSSRSASIASILAEVNVAVLSHTSESIISPVAQSRPGSVCSHKDESTKTSPSPSKLSGSGEHIESETKDLRPVSAQSHTSDKDSEQKSTSRPLSVLSHTSEHAAEIPSSRPESVAEKDETKSTSVADDVIDARPDSVESDKDQSVQQSQADTSIQAAVSSIMVEEVKQEHVTSEHPKESRSTSIASSIGEKVEPRPPSAGSQATSTHELAESRPSSVSSHKADLERPLSSQSQTSEKESLQASSKQSESIPESTHTHVEKDSVDSRPTSEARHVEEIESKDSRPASSLSQATSQPDQTKDTTRSPSVAGSIPESSQHVEIAESETKDSRPASSLSQATSQPDKTMDTTRSPSVAGSIPESSGSHVEIAESESKDSRPASSMSQAKSEPEPTKDSSRSPSISANKESVDSRPASEAGHVEDIDTKESRPASSLSQTTSQTDQTKDAIRPPSVAGSIPESSLTQVEIAESETKDSRPASSLSQATSQPEPTKDSSRSPSVTGSHVEIAESETKDSRPVSSLSQATSQPDQTKDTTRSPSVAGSIPESSVSNVEILEKETKDSRPASSLSQSTSQPETTKDLSRSPSIAGSIPETTQSQVDKESVDSRPVSEVRHVEEIDTKDSRPVSSLSQATSQPDQAKDAESSLSHVDIAESETKDSRLASSLSQATSLPETTKETTHSQVDKESVDSRPASEARHVEEIDTKDSRPVSSLSQATSQPDQAKDATRSPSVAGSIPESSLSHVDIVQSETKDSRPASRLSQATSQPEPTKDSSRTPSVAGSHVDTAEIETKDSRPASSLSHATSQPEPTKDSSRTPSVTGSHVEISESEAKDSRPASSLSQATSQPDQTKETTRSPSVAGSIPESSVCHVDIVESETKDSRPASSLSQATSQPDQAKDATRSPSVAGSIPESSLSHVDIAESETKDSRPASSLSQATSLPETTKETTHSQVDKESVDSRPASEARHVEEIDTKDSRPASSLSHVTSQPDQAKDHDEITESETKDSRPASSLSKAASQPEPQKDSSRSPYVAGSHVEIAETETKDLRPASSLSQATSQPDQSKDTTRSPSVAGSIPESSVSHVEIAESETKDSRPASSLSQAISHPEPSKDSSRSPSIAGSIPETTQSQVDKESVDSRPASEARHIEEIDTKDSRPVSSLSQATSAKDHVVISESETKDSRPASSLSQAISQTEPTKDSSRSPSIAGSQVEIAESETKDSRPADSLSQATSQPEQTKDSSRSPSIAGSIPETTQSKVDQESVDSRPASEARHVEEIDTKDSRPVSSQSQATSQPDQAKDHIEIAESETKDSRPASSLSQATSQTEPTKDSSRSPSVAGSNVEIAESETKDSRPASSLSQATSQPDQTKETTRSPSVAGSIPESSVSHVDIADSETKDSRPVSSLSQATSQPEQAKDVSRTPSVAGSNVEIAESETKDSRPASSLSQATTQPNQAKDTTRSPSVAGSIPESSLSHVDIADSDTKDSRPASSLSQATSQHEQAKDVSRTPSVAGSIVESTHSHVEKDSVDSRSASEARQSDIGECDTKDDRPASSLSQTSSQQEHAKDVSRVPSIAGSISDGIQSSVEKDPKVVSRSPSVAGSVAESETKPASRPVSSLSHTSDKLDESIPKESKESSRPVSSLSHTSEDKIDSAQDITKDTSRSISRTSQVSDQKASVEQESASASDKSEAVKESRSASVVSGTASVPVETSRPVSSLSHTSDQAKDSELRAQSVTSHQDEITAPHFDSRPQSVASTKGQEEKDSRPQSVVSTKSDAAPKEQSRPQSSLSHASEKPIEKGLETTTHDIVSRPDSVTSHKSDMEHIEAGYTSRPISSLSYTSDCVAQELDTALKELSRPASSVSHISEKELSKPATEIPSRSNSVTSHISEHEPARSQSRRESTIDRSSYMETDEVITVKDTRSKSVSSIMMTSMYKPEGLEPLAAFDEDEHAKEDTETSTISRKASSIVDKAIKDEEHEPKEYTDSPDNDRLSTETNVSGKSSPTSDPKLYTKPGTSTAEPSKMSTESDISGRSTPDIAEVDTRGKLDISQPLKDQSGMSSPFTQNTISDSISIATSLGHGSETSTSSPQPTSPFPKGIGSLKAEEIKTSSGVSSPDMTRVSTPDMDLVEGKVVSTTTTTTTTTSGSVTQLETKEISSTTSVDSKTPEPQSTRSEISSSESQATTKDVLTHTTSAVTLIKSEFRSFTPTSDDYDLSSPRAHGYIAGSDDEIAASPLSATSHAAHSPTSKFSYEHEYELQRSSSSKTAELDIDDSQDDIPPEYGSHEVETAMSVTSAYKPDPMSTSFYGKLPESSPIPISVRTVITKQYDDYTSSGAESGTSQESDHRFLEEADQEFEKALEEHIQVRGSDIMSSVTSKYAFSPSKEELLQKSYTTAKEFPLEDVLKPKQSELESTSTTITQTQQQQQSSSATTTTSSEASGTTTTTITTQQLSKEEVDDIVSSWGKPLGLPSPVDAQTTPKKERRLVLSKTKLNNEKNLRKRSESPGKSKKITPIYMDLTYVPHNGNSYYSHVEFFKRIRARYYVFSGTEPSRDVYNALLEAKQTWEDKDLEVTIIPTYDTDVLGYWVSENEDLLAKYHIDLSPSASRCTINLQDHETSCSAYRLEF